ncbi:NADPH-dependent F420 reductase [Paenibacillus roseipurpureus]|uniref:NADPH-dependent F420 reductase n=1 Tax=Paenibacillus roseopurpureus TaxID=2918901 RepID=A0AA96RJ21_9BACL|nr:NADPH-dependent F420 reductase [Paenibacillus sp. MBLB1832]WNR42696.1 NADPH-dependent F420 reductase [Paenibacillus sp. MBLB1832]
MAKIAIIGTGNMGKGIASSFARAGHKVLLGSRSQEQAQEIAVQLKQVNIQGVSNAHAIQGAEIIFLAVPFQAVQDIITQHAPELSGKIIVDITNPLNASYDGLTTSADTSAAEIIAQQLPNSRVVGAFKNTFAGVFANPSFENERKSAVLVISDDEEAKAQVISLISELPFEVLDAGSLNNARTIEQMTVLLIGLSAKHNYNWHAGFAIVS